MLPLLKHYSKLPKATRIIVVWSDKRLTPPVKEWEELGPHPIPVHFRVQERDSIMNKLQPFPEIDTPGNVYIHVCAKINVVYIVTALQIHV